MDRMSARLIYLGDWGCRGGNREPIVLGTLLRPGGIADASTQPATKSRRFIRSPQFDDDETQGITTRLWLHRGRKCCVKMRRIAEDGYGSFASF
jgi:hypothetical protein